MTVRHIVMWRVRGESAVERRTNAQRVRDAFAAMQGRIPGMKHLEVAIDESGVDYACDVLLLSDFESFEALSAYANHPEHLRAKQAAGELRIARYQVDYVTR